MKLRRDTAQGPFAVSRRDFLVYGSACALSPLLPIPAEATQSDVLQHSIGYVPPTSDWADPDLQKVVSAEVLPYGDSAFLDTGVKLTIDTCFGEEFLPPSITSVSIDVHFNGVAGVPQDKPLLFHAWRHDRGDVPNSATGTSFLVPVARRAGLRFSLKAHHFAGKHQETLVEFTLDSAFRKPKLLRGIYFVAFADPRTGCLPEWGRHVCRMNDTSGALMPPLMRKNLLSDALTEPGFAYVLLAVDSPETRSTTV